MNTISIVDDYHTGGAIRVYLTKQGTPVLIKHEGRYPAALCSDGRTTKEVPYIEIAVSGTTCGEERTYQDVSVTVYGGSHHGRRRFLSAYSSSKIRYDKNKNKPVSEIRPPHPHLLEELIERGEFYVQDAEKMLLSMDEIYDTAASILLKTVQYANPFSRLDYEAACAALGMPPISDVDCTSYGVKFGDFNFPEYSAEHCNKMKLARLRMRGLEDDAEKESACAKDGVGEEASGITPSGQLWEACGICGKEPVYMPLHLCHECWPKMSLRIE